MLSNCDYSLGLPRYQEALRDPATARGAAAPRSAQDDGRVCLRQSYAARWRCAQGDGLRGPRGFETPLCGSSTDGGGSAVVSTGSTDGVVVSTGPLCGSSTDGVLVSPGGSVWPWFRDAAVGGKTAEVRLLSRRDSVRPFFVRVQPTAMFRRGLGLLLLVRGGCGILGLRLILGLGLGLLSYPCRRNGICHWCIAEKGLDREQKGHFRG